MHNMSFINNNFLKWDMDIQSWSEIDKGIRARAETLLERSEMHLDHDKSKDSRAECLVSLKRCLNQRLKSIESIHEFKNLDIPKKPKGYLELLEVLGIVRPLLIKKLMKIRNDIEHEDVNPPSYNQCKEYIDVVWYFLKSTNKHVSMRTSDLLFKKLSGKGIETQYWANLDIKDKRYSRVHITGWFPKSYIKQKTTNSDFIPLDVSEIHTKQERWKDSERHQDKLNTDIWVNGFIVLSEQQRLKIVRLLMEM